MQGTVFLSYAHENTGFVQKLAGELEAHGVDVWRDASRLKSGDRWSERIAEGLARSRAVVVVLSPDAVASKWVQHEVLFGFSRDKPIFPVLYRNTDLPDKLAILLEPLQQTDLTGGLTDDAVRRLATSLIAVESADQGTQVAAAGDAAPAAHDESAHTIFIEEIEEFLPRVSRRILWRFLSIPAAGERSVWRRIANAFVKAMLVAFIRPVAVLRYFLFMFGALVLAFVLGLVIVEDAPFVRVVTTWQLYAISGGVAAAMALLYAPLTWIARRMVPTMMADLYAWAPHRPLGSGGNKLLDHWGHIEPIVKRLLAYPVREWDGHISRLCPDRELRRHVVGTLATLLALSSGMS